MKHKIKLCRLFRLSVIYPADASHKVNHFEIAIQVSAVKVGKRNAGRHDDLVSELSVKGRHRNPDLILSGVDANINMPAGTDHLYHGAFKHLRHDFQPC